LEDEETKTRLTLTLVDSRARRGDPVAALDWMLARATSVPAAAFEHVGFIYAQSDPRGAAAYVDRVPSGARAAWIAAVAVGYAAADLQGATLFLERFRGEPAFDRGAVMLAQQLATSDPPAAAQLLASVGTRAAGDASAELAIARSWAERDPAAAAAWAMDLGPLHRTIAVSIVTSIWGSRDPDAVRAWALRLPPGDQRDMALGAALRVRGAAPLDPALLAAFSQDRARQAAIVNVIFQTASSDPAAARRLLAEHITEPRMREQAEQMIDSFARGAVPTPAGGFARPPAGPSRGSVPNGQSATLLGPNGQPVLLRPPEAGLRPLPPGAYLGPIPRTPPAREPPPDQTAER
jgi:hypothetical protein